ncbi:MAG: T9SS type A sorting domain-containing protein [Bacteroidia bacterium]|nr:T9SS type A sorting domain-containing protein [Bacteroidia bacterium]
MIKSFLLTTISIATSLGAIAQNVNIPDASFKAILVGNSSINSNGDNEIQEVEALVTTYLNISNENIADLTGIEAFTNLSVLVASNNQLTSIDLSQNTLLIGLNVSNNQLSSIDLSQNSLLEGLNCSNNSISVLDVTVNTKLETLFCGMNNISFLDLSQNTALISLICAQNSIITLDLSHTSINQNTTLETPYIDCRQNNLKVLIMKNISTNFLSAQNFNATSNPNLSCIEVDDTSNAKATWINKDAAAKFSLNCNFKVGISDLESDEQFFVYPNPAASFLLIESINKIISINILDAMGRTININLSENNTLDVSNLSNGVYLLQIETVNGVISKKFVKD